MKYPEPRCEGKGGLLMIATLFALCALSLITVFTAGYLAFAGSPGKAVLVLGAGMWLMAFLLSFWDNR